jgi:L-alanine-DL-glutamate epimerase-like enolase superfamily enzyme
MYEMNESVPQPHAGCIVSMGVQASGPGSPPSISRPCDQERSNSVRIIDIREQTVPIEADMSNAFINFSKMNVSVLAIVTDQTRDGKRVVGFGFNSNGRYAQGGLLRERIIPRVLEASPDSLIGEHGDLDPELIWGAAMRDEKPGGHGDRAVAMGILDMATWDLAAKLGDVPLYRLLSERARDPRTPATPLEKVWVYAAGGYYYPGRGIEALQAEMLSYVDMGYRTVKMKIGGAPLDEDLRRIEAVLEVLPEGCDLAVDANGRFDLDQALAYADALSAYPLHWYEEAGDPLDYEALHRLADRYQGALATGENLLSFHEVRNLIRYGGLRPDRDILQMDPTLSYGLTEFRRTVAMLFDSGWNPDRCVPHGGHQFNLSIASAFHLHGCESYPGIFEPFGGFADGYPIEDGHVRLPDAPGIGLEQKSSLAPVLADLMA